MMEISKPTLYKYIDSSVEDIGKPIKSQIKKFTPSVPSRGNGFFRKSNSKTQKALGSELRAAFFVRTHVAKHKFYNFLWKSH
jgi:hypothetical protein